MSRERSSERPGQIAQDLYLARGARDAAHRCDVNLQLGNFDLGAAILETLRLIPGESLVDVGCGSGTLLQRFSERVAPDGEARGFDISSEAIESARLLGVRADVADAVNLPIDDSQLDALTCIFAIYYHDDLAAVLAEFARVVKVGGRLVVAGPALDTNRELYEFHKRATGANPSDADKIALGFVAERVRDGLARAGFEELDTATHTNRVVFPAPSDFLDYWKATSLFARTPGASLEEGRRVLRERSGAVTLTKRVTLLSAVRR